MIMVLVVIIVFTYQGMKEQHKSIIESIMSNKSSREDPSSLENRVASIIYVMYDIAVNPARNTNDENTMYQIWYSTMLKRGLPDNYVTPELFAQLKDLIDHGNFAPNAVEKIVRPYFEKERPPVGEGIYFPFRPVCLNY